MAFSALCGILCALVSFGGSAAENCKLGDILSLHQQAPVALRLRSRAGDTSAGPVKKVPDKSATTRVRPLLREAADGILKRATARLKLPSIPAVFRWQLVGKVTSWAVGLYQQPQTEATLNLLDDIIDLGAEVLGSKNIDTMEDAELAARLGNATKLYGIMQNYIHEAGAPPGVVTLVDLTAQTVESTGRLDPTVAAQLIVDVANETSGPAMAELLMYQSVIAQSHMEPDLATIAELHIPVLAQFGAPPAVGEYLQTIADNERLQHVPVDRLQECARTQRMLATASRQLKMPSAIPEILEYTANVTGNASQSHTFEKPEEVAKIMGHLNLLEAKLAGQLGLPPAVSQLVRRLGAAQRNESAPSAAEILGLLSNASRQLDLPSAVAELFEYLAPFATRKGGAQPERQHLQELLLRLGQQIGAPEAVAEFSKEVTDSTDKNGGKMEPRKITKQASKLLRKLGMPAFADLFGKIVAPVMKGKQPDPMSLAAAMPSLMKAAPDFETAAGLASDLRAKLMRPLVPVYQSAVESLTGAMPESGLKALLTRVLALAKPRR